MKKNARASPSMKKMQERLKAWFNINKNTFGLYFTIAKVVGPEWTLLEKILLGNIPERKAAEGEKPLKPFEIPGSTHPFNAMGKVPPERRVQMLQAVVDREMKLKV